MTDKIWYSHSGAADVKITTAENKLGFVFPADFRELYLKSDGCGMDIGYSYLHLWCIDSITAANEIFCEIEQGRYIFFADADDSIDSFAYDKKSGKIYVFATENGIDEGRYCADNISEMINYVKQA